MSDLLSLSDALSLLHSERRTLELLYEQPDRSVGLPRAQLLRSVNQDPERLDRLVRMRVLVVLGERCALSPDMETLLGQLITVPQRPTAQHIDALLTALVQALPAPGDGQAIRQWLRQLLPPSTDPAERIKALQLLGDQRAWQLACQDQATLRQHADTLDQLDRAHSQWEAAQQALPAAWHAPVLRHLQWLEGLMASGTWLSHTNVAQVLTEESSLWLDGKLSLNLRPSLADVSALRPPVRQRPGKATPSLPVPDEAAPADWTPRPVWATLRDAFRQSDTDLLTFLRGVSEEQAVVASLFQQALGADADHLQVTTELLPWADRQWAQVYWRSQEEHHAAGEKGEGSKSD
jgi:hypothetical protein